VAPVKHETKNLLLARADVHLTNLYGRTALHYAAMGRILSAFWALVDAGALPDELDHHGFIAVQHAVLMKRADWEYVTTS
jgi:ankyrin repeat protein